MAIKMPIRRKIIGVPGIRIMKETIIDPVVGIDSIAGIKCKIILKEIDPITEIVGTDRGITHKILTKETILMVEIAHKATTKMTIEKITVKMTIEKTTTRRTIEMIIGKKVTRTRDIREKIIMKTSVKMGI